MVTGTLWFLLMVLFAHSAEAGPAVIYPVDRMVVHESKMPILGVTDTPDEHVRITLNGGGIIPVVGDDGTFRTEVQLRPGRNIIKVDRARIYISFESRQSKPPRGFSRSYLHPPVEDCSNCHPFASPGDYSTEDRGMTLCLNCHDDPGVGRDGKPLAHLHSPLADDRECGACHDPHVGVTRYLNPEPVPDLCLGCHESVTEGRAFPHGPAAAGDCTGCHSPHGSDNPAMLLVRGNALCLECHDDPLLDPGDPGQALEVAHAAVEDGCTICHDPHASDYRFHLPLPQMEVCAGCHDDVPPPGEGIRGHSPIADDGECVTCHSPHASGRRNLLHADIPALCYECHDDATAEGKDGGVVHAPVGEGGCTECHNPHGGVDSLLVKGVDTLCFDCHDSFEADEGGSVHEPVSWGGCTECHRHHAAPYPSLLAETGTALCYQCHDSFEGSRLHGPIAEDDSCTGCHSPHAGQAAKLLPLAGMALCLECHDNPTVLPGMQLPRSIHLPISDGRGCTPCHSPHAGTGRMLREPYPALCSRCHKDPMIDEGGRRFANLHTPVGDGECLGCHLPHASVKDRLLEEAGNSLCLICHDDPLVDGEGRAWQSEHPSVADDCRNCHLPHASPYPFNLRDEIFDLCRVCHSDHEAHTLDASVYAEENRGGFVKLPDEFPLTGEGRMVCTGCHEPHGSDHSPLLDLPKTEICKRCHSI